MYIFTHLLSKLNKLWNNIYFSLYNKNDFGLELKNKRKSIMFTSCIIMSTETNNQQISGTKFILVTFSYALKSVFQQTLYIRHRLL